MNQDNLRTIIDNYLQKFDFLNNDTNKEFVKWTAVFHFQKHWDIHALDFASMFKKAVSKTEMLINNQKEAYSAIITCITNGLSGSPLFFSF